MECVTCRDPNGRIQLVAFGYISGKDTDAYVEFLTMFKELAYSERKKSMINEPIGNIIVCDRSKAQTKAVKRIFTESKIIYCKVHILRNIRSYLGVSSKLAGDCNKMFSLRTEKSEKTFLETLNKLPES